MRVEACIHCDRLESMTRSVHAAFSGGASRIELCADMSVDGLTPAREFILAARQHFARPGVLVMIRPRAGDFCYDHDELHIMRRQIDDASECGADGVVFGILQKNNKLDVPAITALIETSKKKKLQVTFHRAFDATPNTMQTLETLIGLGCDRVLTSGTAWGDGRGALDGLATLGELIEAAADRIEIVIGGGVTPENAGTIAAAMPPRFSRVSMHAYSGIRKNGQTDAERVGALVKQALHQ